MSDRNRDARPQPRWWAGTGDSGRAFGPTGEPIGAVAVSDDRSPGTLYLSTERSVANVRRAIASTTVETGTPTIRSVEGKDTLENATELLEKLPDGATLIVDPIAELERHDRSTYVSFLNSLKERMVENESIAVLHCLTAPEPPDNRTATIHAVDAVFDLQPATTDSGTAIEHELSIRKFRADSAGTETVELAFGDSRPMAIEPKPETT